MMIMITFWPIQTKTKRGIQKKKKKLLFFPFMKYSNPFIKDSEQSKCPNTIEEKKNIFN